jgi:hypothetical protein
MIRNGCLLKRPVPWSVLFVHLAGPSSPRLAARGVAAPFSFLLTRASRIRRSTWATLGALGFHTVIAGGRVGTGACAAHSRADPRMHACAKPHGSFRMLAEADFESFRNRVTRHSWRLNSSNNAHSVSRKQGSKRCPTAALERSEQDEARNRRAGRNRMRDSLPSPCLHRSRDLWKRTCLVPYPACRRAQSRQAVGGNARARQRWRSLSVSKGTAFRNWRDDLCVKQDADDE